MFGMSFGDISSSAPALKRSLCLLGTPQTPAKISSTVSANVSYYKSDATEESGSPKTDESVRTVVIPKFLVEEIRVYVNTFYSIPADERIFQIVPEAVQPMIIEERLGHKDIKATLNTYGHLYPSEQEKVAEML